MSDKIRQHTMTAFDSYLGDGVYASFDGYHVILDLRGQDSTTRIALEPEVLRQLDIYRQSLYIQLANEAMEAMEAKP